MPQGTYRLLGYRLVKGDWMISTTGGRAKVELRAGEIKSLEPSSTIKLKLKVRRQAGGVQIKLGVSNGRHMGLSLYKAAKRIPLPYTILSAAGEELASGTLNYG